MTKIEKLLNHLQGRKSITGIEAMKKFNLYRLSSSIHALKAKGHNIKTEMVRNKRTKEIHAKYTLIKK